MPGQEKDNLLIDYKIFETNQFEEDLHQIAASGQSKIVRKLRSVVYPQLRQHPRGGAWRFFFEIDEQEHVVFMTAAHHRSRAY